MKTFYDFYNSMEFENFREFVKTEYSVELILTPFDSFIISKDDGYIHEIQFDVNFDNDRSCETANIISLCALINNLKEESSNKGDNYFKETKTITRINKRSMFFGKIRKSCIGHCNITYTRRHKHYHSYETRVHDELITAYREHSA